MNLVARIINHFRQDSKPQLSLDDQLSLSLSNGYRAVNWQGAGWQRW